MIWSSEQQTIKQQQTAKFKSLNLLLLEQWIDFHVYCGKITVQGGVFSIIQCHPKRQKKLYLLVMNDPPNNIRPINKIEIQTNAVHLSLLQNRVLSHFIIIIKCFVWFCITFIPHIPVSLEIKTLDFVLFWFRVCVSLNCLGSYCTIG